MKQITINIKAGKVFCRSCELLTEDEHVDSIKDYHFVVPEYWCAIYGRLKWNIRWGALRCEKCLKAQIKS